MLTAVIFFLAISLTVVLGVASPILKQVKISNDMIQSKASYYLAEGALEDALYRIQTNKTIASGDTVVVNGYTSTITLTTTLDGKTIDSLSTIDGIQRKMEAQVIAGVGASFNYGIQTGEGGFSLNGGSTVNGNVYSNGSILSSDGSTITGSAVAANSAALSSDQTNATPIPITSCTSSNCITFRDSTATQDFAQSFKVSSSSPINKIQLYIKKFGTPSDANVRIVTDSNGSPSTNNLLTSNGILSSNLVTTSFGLIDVVLPSNPSLDPAQTYWIVIDSSGNSTSAYYVLGGNSLYANGSAKTGRYGSTWVATSPTDSYFNVFLGGLNSTIGGGSFVGAIKVGGDAWGNTVTGASVTGTLYCQVGGTGNTYHDNKACDTSRSDPSPSSFPISDSNIEQWKSEATAGGIYNGNVAIGSAGTTTGPIEINGNLLIDGGGKFTMTGTIYVTGSVTISGGASLALSSSYGSNSGVLISDGIMNFNGGSKFAGSGQSTSYPLMITTSDCPAGPTCAGNYALSLGGGAGAVVLNAQSGTLYMAGGSGARELTANQIIIDGGGVVTYSSGLASQVFSSGPSGGWNVSGWKEVQ